MAPKNCTIHIGGCLNSEYPFPPHQLSLFRAVHRSFIVTTVHITSYHINTVFFFRGTPSDKPKYTYGNLKAVVRTAFCKENFEEFNLQIRQPHNAIHNFFDGGSMEDSGIAFNLHNHIIHMFICMYIFTI